MGKILKYKPIIGSVYGDWTVISDKTYNKPTNRATYWKVRCKCGEEGIRSAVHLVKNHVSSCRSCAALKLSFEQSYLNRIKRRATNMEFEFNLTLEYMLSIFNGKCSVSGESIKFGKHWNKLSNEQTASLDRIDSNKGYIIGNVQWVHKDVNFMKGSLDEERFLELCKKITNEKFK